VRYYRDLPTRFAVIPRRGTAADIRWFEADPTYVLHWINAYEDGDEIVLDGFFQSNPNPKARPDATLFEQMFRFVDLAQLQAHPHRWRFNMRTGATTEEHLDERIFEFGMINNGRAGLPYRYTYAVTGKPGWFLFDGLAKIDVQTGHVDEYRFPDGVFASETPMAPRSGLGPEAAEDDGYLVTFTTDMNNDASECLVFAAQDVAGGPIARVRLPERISSGTHSCWAPRTSLRSLV